MNMLDTCNLIILHLMRRFHTTKLYMKFVKFELLSVSFINILYFKLFITLYSDFNLM